MQQKLYSKNYCDVLQCVQCGLGRAECASFDIHDYYTADYFSGGYCDGYADYLGSEPVLRREFARTVQFIRRFRDGGRLLEVGCAYGFFLEETRRFYDAAGIEIAEAAAAFCRDRGLNVIGGVADESNLERCGMVDVIVLLDVIEHLPEPQSTLSLCRRYLNPGGIIVITTGDFASLYARLTGRHWRLMTPPQHLWYFTPQSMRRLAHSLGLHVEACDHPWKLVPLALIQFQTRRLFGLHGRMPAGFASRLGLPINLFDAMRCVLRNPENR
ncbi:MAG TPA: class I SAM-dependent methyltransferase [Xanthobacteraceae bacterium]|nr:class I SAM-dependent methyltransferase [Xanthobacteraceae bacterium]